METTYKTYDSPFGPCRIGSNAEGICELSFIDEPADTHAKDFDFNEAMLSPLNLSGTPFQIKVWKALLQIPKGQTRSYADIARAVGSPKAVRAVGTACGKNKIAYLIPCHRVLTSSGKLGGYRWGVERKKAMLAWEAYRHAPI